VSVSHFPRFPVVFFFFFFFLPYSRSNCVCVTFSTFFSFLAIFQVLLPYTRSYSVHFLFFTLFSVFLTLFHVLKCVFLIFHNFQFSCHSPGPTVCIYHFLCFSVFLAIFQVLQCLCLLFNAFQVSSHIYIYIGPSSWSYRLHFSISTFLRLF